MKKKKKPTAAQVLDAVREARAILCEMQKWRRGLPPYDGDTPETHRPMPHTGKEFGEAIDLAIECFDYMINE